MLCLGKRNEPRNPPPAEGKVILEIDMRRASEQEKKLAKKIETFLRKLTPPKTRLVVCYEYGYAQVAVTCDGSQRYMVYRCCLDPGHKGLCYCLCKHVNFKRDRRRKA
jgi:hypothetical protein